MKAVNGGSLVGVKLCRGCPTLSHIFFADDSLFFIRASLQNCLVLDKILSDYCIASGQQVNHDKSSIFFSPNTPESIFLPICSLLKIPQVDNPGKYLGLPTIWGRSKKEALVYIKEGICNKLTGWKQNCLSMAGKEVLLKAVAQAIPSYPMMCFKFPTSLCKDLSSEMANFWWGGDEIKAKTHWKNWPHMCKSKEEGGLGFRDLDSFNIALLAKQCWRIINNLEIYDFFELDISQIMISLRLKKDTELHRVGPVFFKAGISFNKAVSDKL